jgi:DnaJ-class molecular chaperone
MENKNCFSCRHCLEFKGYKNLVKCQKASQLFGGERWVEAKEVATCGVWEAFRGDDSRAPDLPEETPKVRKMCNFCRGTGKVRTLQHNKHELTECSKCMGSGELK